MIKTRNERATAKTGGKTRGDRLRIAREQLFPSARVAAQAIGVAVSTYSAHERAEDPLGRDYGPDQARYYGKRFRVTPEWLLTGFGPGPTGESTGFPEPDPAIPRVLVMGYVGAGSTAHFYDVDQGNLDEVTPPEGATPSTIAVEIRGDSLGTVFNRWLVFYDNIHRPVTPELIGELCIVGLADGRILIKQLQRGKTKGLFNLISSNDKPILDVEVEWAARVDSIARRPNR
jgi:hypothetical protein